MILSVHAVFGAGVAWEIYRLTGSMPLALLASLVSHYFLDLFPHVEYLESVQTSIRELQERTGTDGVRDAVKIGADFLAGFLITGLFSADLLVALAGAFVALIPDGMTAVYCLKPFASMTAHQRWHGAIQYFTKKTLFPAWVGIATQLIALVTGVILLVQP